jgi:hypothetical protein
MDVEAVFFKPFEVTQFWISDNYDSQAVGDDNGYIVFRTKSDKPDKWFLEVSLGKGRPFVGDFIPPFLPTRENIAILNAAIKPMTEIARASERAGEFAAPKTSPLAGIKASPVPVTRDINDERYRKALFEVFAADWGIVLPQSPSQFGQQIIHLKYRQGLPCGPAMISAVQPILEAAWGALKKREVATSQSDGMTIDTVTYIGQPLTGRKQAFDITEYFGKSLPNFHFNFSPDDPKILYKEVADPEVLRSIGSYLNVVATQVVKGNDPHISCSAAYQALTGKTAKMSWMVSRPSLVEMCDHLVSTLHDRDMTTMEREWAKHHATQYGFYEDTAGNIALRLPKKKKPWWKIWG